MGTPKDHYVPQFLLRRFSSTANQRLIWRFDRQTMSISEARVSDIWSAPLYDAAAHAKGIWEIENNAAAILHDRLPSPTKKVRPQDWEAMFRFVALSYLRTPKARATHAVRKAMLPAADASVHLNEIEEPIPAVEALKKRNWYYTQIENGSLVLGDNPVQIVNRVDEAPEDTSLKNVKNDIFLPLSPNTIFIGTYRTEKEPHPPWILQIQHCTRAQFYFSERYVFGPSKEFLETAIALAGGNLEILKPEPIGHYPVSLGDVALGFLSG